MPVPEGFVAFGDHHYKFVKGLYTFAEAQSGAAALGGYVATVTSAEENAFLAGLIAGEDIGAWLGGSDAAEEGVWRWTEGPETGTNFWNGLAGGSAPDGAYTNWYESTPNGVHNGLEEDHVHMIANSDLWNDASGHAVTIGYFVEIDGGTPPPNQPPTITSNGGGATGAITVAENGTAVTGVTASDADGDTLVFSIAGGADAARFAINPNTGALSFVEAPDFEAPADAGGNNVYDVVVRASDQGGSDTQALAVTVTDVDDTGDPTIPPGFVAFNGHYYKYVKGLYTFTEAQAGAAALGGHLATVTSAAENAFLANLIAGQDLGAWLGGSDAAEEGVWRWTEGPEAGVNFWNGLAGGSAPGGAYTNWNEGEPNGVHNGLEEDHLHMMANSSLWNDAPSHAFTIGYLVEIANRSPTITSNGGGATAAIAVGENTTAVTTVRASDADGDALTFAIAGGADAARFAIDSDTGVLVFVTAPDFEAPGDSGGDNVYDVVVRASDGNDGADSQALAVTVTNFADTPNRLPRITSNGAGATAALNVKENTFAVTTVRASDADADALVFSIAGGLDAARFNINPNSGALAFVTRPDFERPRDANHDNIYKVTVRVDDGHGGADSQALSVTVTNVAEPNRPPTITSNGGGAAAAIKVKENTSAVTTVRASDADGDSLKYAIVGGTDAARFQIDARSGALTFASKPDFEAPRDTDRDNVYKVIVQANDGHGGSDRQTLSVSVANVAETDGPAGFAAFNGHFYRFVSGQFTHGQAAAAARAQGGYLATVTSAQENDFLANLMAGAGAGGHGGWLGGSDAAGEGVWRWSGGPELGRIFWNGAAGGSAPQGRYTEWLPGEPSRSTAAAEDYLHMVAGSDQWSDVTSTTRMGYFVEIA